MKTSLPSTIGRPATSALESANITCLEDLKAISEKDLASLHGIGPKAIRILKTSLDELNMCLLSPN